MRGGGCAAEVSLLEPRVLLAGTGETDPPSDPIASPDPTSPSTPTSPPTQSQSDAAASSPGLSFASSLVSADKAYSATTLDAHVGLALDYVDADKSYYDAEDASFRLYGEDLDAADGDYLDALEAAETAYYEAESAACQQLEDDFDRARANYDPAASAAGAVMYDAVGAAWDQRDATVADADAARDDAYVAADSLYAEYWEALDDAERQYQADLDAASEGAYSTFEDAERAAAERRQQAEADAEPLYDRYWDAIVAADAEFGRAVAAAEEVLRRAEADAWGVFSAAEAVAADEREIAEREAWDARSEATDEADRTRDAAVTAAEEQWDAAEETAWESHEDRRLDAAVQWYFDVTDAEEAHAERLTEAAVAWHATVAGSATSLVAAALAQAGDDETEDGPDPGGVGAFSLPADGSTDISRVFQQVFNDLVKNPVRMSVPPKEEQHGTAIVRAVAEAMTSDGILDGLWVGGDMALSFVPLPTKKLGEKVGEAAGAATSWAADTAKRLATEYYLQEKEGAENRQTNTDWIAELIATRSNRPEVGPEAVKKYVTELLDAHEATNGDLPQTEDTSNIDKDLKTSFHARASRFREPGSDQFRMVVLLRFESYEAPERASDHVYDPHKFIRQADLVVTAEGTVQDRFPAAGTTVVNEEDGDLKHEVLLIKSRTFTVR